MAEYISKEQIIEWFRPYGHTGEGILFDVLKTDIAGIPAADVAPVVRYRDCKYYDECTNFLFDDDYCSRCERK